MKVTAKHIQKLLTLYRRKWAWPKRLALVPNVIPLCYSYECDVVEITNSFLWHEYEIKISHGDFLADFKKGKGWHNYGWKKHDRIKEKKGPNYFWFVAPKGIIKEEEIPEYAGFIEFDIKDDGTAKGHVVKHAPRLHNNKIDQKSIFNLFIKLSSKCFVPYLKNKHLLGM